MISTIMFVRRPLNLVPPVRIIFDFYRSRDQCLNLRFVMVFTLAEAQQEPQDDSALMWGTEGQLSQFWSGIELRPRNHAVLEKFESCLNWRINYCQIKIIFTENRTQVIKRLSILSSWHFSRHYYEKLVEVIFIQIVVWLENFNFWKKIKIECKNGVRT